MYRLSAAAKGKMERANQNIMNVRVGGQMDVILQKMPLKKANIYPTRPGFFFIKASQPFALDAEMAASGFCSW